MPCYPFASASMEVYTERFLDEAECAELLRHIDARPWRADLRRRVQHHGYAYDYKARRTTRDLHLGPLPEFLATLARRLTGPGMFPRVPDQVTINEYLPGQGIARHVDCVPCFGDVIASVSLGSACELELEHPATREVRRHLLRLCKHGHR